MGGFDGVLAGIDLIMIVINVVAICGYWVYAGSMFTLNAIGMWDEQAQKQRMKAVKSSGMYLVLSLIIIAVLFGAMKLFNLDGASDAGRSQLWEFLEDSADNIENGNYNFDISDDDGTGYGSSYNDSLNYGGN